MSFNEALMHLLFKALKSGTLAFIDLLVCSFHFTWAKLFNRLCVIAGFLNSLIHFVKVGFSC